MRMNYQFRSHMWSSPHSQQWLTPGNNYFGDDTVELLVAC